MSYSFNFGAANDGPQRRDVNAEEQGGRKRGTMEDFFDQLDSPMPCLIKGAPPCTGPKVGLRLWRAVLITAPDKSSHSSGIEGNTLSKALKFQLSLCRRNVLSGDLTRCSLAQTLL